MKNSVIYNRTTDMTNRLNEFIQQYTLSEINYFEELPQEELIKLKIALSDVNNEMGNGV